MTPAPVTVSLILDRLHAINGLLGSPYKTRRYFPNTVQTAQMPLLVPVFGANQRSSTNSNYKRNTRNYTLVGFVGEFMQGLPTESAQKIAEQMVADVEALYDPRNLLQLTGNDSPGAPDFTVENASYDADTGLIPYPNTTLAAVLFTVVIVNDRFVTRI